MFKTIANWFGRRKTKRDIQIEKKKIKSYSLKEYPRLQSRLTYEYGLFPPSRKPPQAPRLVQSEISRGKSYEQHAFDLVSGFLCNGMEPGLDPDFYSLKYFLREKLSVHSGLSYTDTPFIEILPSNRSRASAFIHIVASGGVNFKINTGGWKNA